MQRAHRSAQRKAHDKFLKRRQRREDLEVIGSRGQTIRQSFAHQVSHQCQAFDSVLCIAELHPGRRPSPNPDKVGSRVAAAQKLVEELLHHERLLLVQRSDRPSDGFFHRAVIDIHEHLDAVKPAAKIAELLWNPHARYLLLGKALLTI